MKGRGGARQPLGVTRPGVAKGARGAQQAKAVSKAPTAAKTAKPAKPGKGTLAPGVKKGVAKSAKVAAKGAVKAALGGETGGRGRAGAVKDAAVALSRARKGTEDAATRQARAAEIYARLARAHPDAHCELDFTSPFELLVATILSAQCTDKRVNMTTPALFAEYPTPAALAAAPRERVEELVKSTGFFRNKAKSIQGMAEALVEEHGGAVPDEMDALVTLPGVGRKTANVILGNAFGRNEGVVVDTHVGRLANRLGLTDETDPVKVEQALMPLFPRERWTMLSHLLIFHGRRICDAKKPKCAECVVAELCPSKRE